jgi:hydantoinase/carbamoylase family amidase
MEQASLPNAVDPRRTIRELKELATLTADERGAQRVAFTPVWQRARTWLRGRFSGLPVEVHDDAAGNLWATLPGRSERAVVLGGHIDSVPNGGWLDGCLGALTAVEVLRRLAAVHGGRPPVTVRVVDWADEEGARFGCSLFGSSACAGTLRPADLRGLMDAQGVSLPDALRAVGLDFDRLHESRAELSRAAAYLEMHVEQGPVLLDRGLPLGAVLGTCGVERHVVTFHGEAAHSGSTPMECRRDALLPAARLVQELYAIAAASGGGVCTVGSCTTRPGIPTSVVEECRLTLDQRHLDAAALARMLEAATSAAKRFASEARVDVTWEPICRVPPAPFRAGLIELCDAAIRDTCGRSHRLPSGPLHDATSMARAGIPTTMLFVQSLRGLSHNPAEDTREEHLELAVRAFDRLVEKTIEWVARPDHVSDPSV